MSEEKTTTNKPEASVMEQIVLLAASGRFEVRHILDRTDNGGMVMFGYMNEQSVVQVMAGNSDDLVNAAIVSSIRTAGAVPFRAMDAAKSAILSGSPIASAAGDDATDTAHSTERFGSPICPAIRRRSTSPTA